MTLGGLYEDRSVGSGRVTSRSVYFEGRPVAVIDNASFVTSTRYIHADRLGSSATITDTWGGMARLSDRVRYDPFGERRNPNALSAPANLNHSLQSATFTGHESDDEFALTNMKGRIYDPRVGRFLSPDPVAATSTAQGFDRFAYVRNDPVNSVDPSGLVVVEILGVAIAIPGAVVAVAAAAAGLILAVSAGLAIFKLIQMGIQAVNAANIAYQAALGVGATTVNATAEPMKLSDGGVSSADAGTSPPVRDLLMVGDPGLGRHNVGRNFDRAAQTRAEELRALGHTVEVQRVSSVDELETALKTGEQITGEARLYTHAHTDALYIGEKPGEGTNFTGADAPKLRGNRLGSGVDLTIWGCEGASGPLGQIIADHLEHNVGTFKLGLEFSISPSFNLGGAPMDRRPPENYPRLYMLPTSGASVIPTYYYPRKGIFDEIAPDFIQIP